MFSGHAVSKYRKSCSFAKPFKRMLNGKNISSSVVYCNMDFARMIGMKAYYTIARGGSCREALLGEAAFAQAAFGEMPKGYERYLEKELTPHIGQDSVRKILACLYKARQEADAFLRQAAEKHWRIIHVLWLVHLLRSRIAPALHFLGF